ncbi:hypothetical protein AHAS_Ahas09G0008400 [Arachis hypogaea]
MGFGILRNLIRPLSIASSTALTSRITTAAATTTTSFRGLLFASPKQDPCFFKTHQWILPLSNHLHSLTDTRFPKRRPYAWVEHTPGETILPNKPNEGSIKRRNEKKRMRLRRAFILAERKKRIAQMKEAKRRKNMKRIGRKMAAVAREREWAQRLAELQRLEAEKKKSMA